MAKSLLSNFCPFLRRHPSLSSGASFRQPVLFAMVEESPSVTPSRRSTATNRHFSSASDTLKKPKYRQSERIRKQDGEKKLLKKQLSTPTYRKHDGRPKLVTWQQFSDASLLEKKDTKSSFKKELLTLRFKSYGGESCKM